VTNTCPICGRTFEVTVRDDTFIPACGHYGTDPASGHAPCERDGLAHAWACPEIQWPKTGP
jgi:hypothetical protein